MLQKIKVGIEEGIIEPISSFLSGIILNTLYIIGIIGKDAFIILSIMNIITVILITFKTIKLGFFFLIGWLIGIFISYSIGLLSPISFLVLVIVPILGFFIGIVIKIGIFLLKIFLLIVLSFIAFILILSLFM